MKGISTKIVTDVYDYINVTVQLGASLCGEWDTLTLTKETTIAYTDTGRNGHKCVVVKKLAAGTYTVTNELFGKDPTPGVGKNAYILNTNGETLKANQIVRFKFSSDEVAINIYSSSDGSVWNKLKY